MTSGKLLRPWLAGLLAGLGWLAWSVVPGIGQESLAPTAGRRYGPTAPGGHYIRVQPRAVTMSHNQRPQLTVSVENAAGQPVDGALVTFTPSEGAITTESSQTRGGTVLATFTAAPGSDSPRTAFLIVTVENVEVTVFIDMVPAVFGR